MGRQLQLAPSLLCGDILNLRKTILEAEAAGATILHVDAMDNQFVRGLGFSPEHVRWMRKSTDMWIDVHLMVSPSAEIASAFCMAGASRIILHAEVSDIFAAVEVVSKANCDIGVAINPETDLDKLDPLCEYFSSLLVFTVNPGFRGQKIRSDALQRIANVKKWAMEKGINCSIQVDGGVYPDTIHQMADAGADIFVVGSAFFGADGCSDTIAMVKILQTRP